MIDLRTLLGAAVTQIRGDDARADVEMLAGHVLDKSRAWLFAHGDYRPAAAEVEWLEYLVGARAGGEPIAYLTGRRGFRNLDLAVNPDVLIPRPETELLVELALERSPVDTEFRIADLGTGSGAIALAIASERPIAKIVATDVSEFALAVARENAERLGMDNVTFQRGDWCAALDDRRFDLIVSNPPYIAAEDAHLQQGDLRFEPTMALASGADGLNAIRQIVAEAPRHLCTGAWLLLEHGWEQAARVRELLVNAGFADVQTWRDIADHDRVSGGVRSE